MKTYTIGIASHVGLATALLALQKAAKHADVIIVGEPAAYKMTEKAPIVEFPVLTTSNFESPELYDFKRIKKAKRK